MAKCRQCGDTGFFFSRSLRGDVVCPCVLTRDEPGAIVEPVSPSTPTGRSAVDSLAQFCGVTPAAFRRGTK